MSGNGKRLATKATFGGIAVVKPLSRREAEAERAAQVYDAAQGIGKEPAGVPAADAGATPGRIGYAELHCLSHFSFGRGASSARELFERAKRNGYAALAITDECTLAGIVRAYEASKETGLKLITGTELVLDDGLKLVLLAETQAGYTAICKLITHARRRADKGEYQVTRADLEDGLPGTLALWLPGAKPAAEQGEWLRARFEGRLWLAV